MAVRKNPKLKLGPVRTHTRGTGAVAAIRRTTHAAGTPGVTGTQVRSTPGQSGK